MITRTIRQKLCDYILNAEDKKIKAIYTILETEIDANYNHWKDSEFIKELNHRSADYKSGKIEGASWEEAKDKILNFKK